MKRTFTLAQESNIVQSVPTIESTLCEDSIVMNKNLLLQILAELAVRIARNNMGTGYDKNYE